MRHFKHPATIIALIALFAAVSGGAGAAVSGLISGSQIKNGSIPIKKLSASAIKSLQVTGAARSDGGGNTCAPNTSNAPKFCGNPATVTFDKKTVVLVNGDADLASTNGNPIFEQLGVCYAPHGSLTLTVVQHVYPQFVASAHVFFAQGVTGVVGGLKGRYDVGLCVFGASANLEVGRFAITMVTAETTTGVKKLGPSS